MGPLLGHLSFLWDHLVKRALAAENEPASRVQHLLDDLDLLLTTASDLLSCCADSCAAGAAAGEEDGQVTLSVTLAEALVVERGQWKLRPEGKIPAR